MSEITLHTGALDKVTAAFGDRVQQIALALPDNVSADKFLQIANRALLENPALLNADRASLFTAVSQCGTAGVDPDGRQAALVIYKTKVKTPGEPDRWIEKVQCIIMIGGYRKIAAEYGWSIETDVVRGNDEFDYEGGLHPTLTHRKPPLGAERGSLIGAYAICRHRQHDPIIVVLDGTEVAKAKAASRASKFGPWVDWESEMWAKTAGRKAFKQLPLGERETVRLRALLDESGLGHDPVAELYGSERAQLPAATASAPEDGESHPESAGPVETPQPPGPVDSFDFADVEPVREEDAEAGEQETLDYREGWDPGDTPFDSVPKDQTFAAKGDTIRKVASSQRGRDWLLSILLSAIPHSNPTRMDIAAFLRMEHPETWMRYETKVAEEAS